MRNFSHPRSCGLFSAVAVKGNAISRLSPTSCERVIATAHTLLDKVTWESAWPTGAMMLDLCVAYALKVFK